MYSLIAVFGLICVLSLFVYKLHKDGLTLTEVLQRNKVGVFAGFSSFLSMGEVISLALQDITKNNQEAFGSLLRYGGAGFFEAVIGFLFITDGYALVKTWKSLTSKDKVIKSIILLAEFICSLGVTGFLFALYLESINVFTVDLTNFSIMFPLAYVDYSALQGDKILELIELKHYYELEGNHDLANRIEIPGRIRIGAIFTAYSSTLINLLLLVFAIREKPEDTVDEVTVEVVTDGVTVKKKSEDDFVGGATGALVVYENIFPSINISYKDFVSWLKDHVGIDNTGFNKKSTTNPKAVDESSALQLVQELITEFIGSKSIGGLSQIAFYHKLCESGIDECNQLKDVIGKCNQQALSASLADKNRLAAEITAHESDLKAKFTTVKSNNTQRIASIKNFQMTCNAKNVKPKPTFIKDSLTQEIEAFTTI